MISLMCANCAKSHSTSPGDSLRTVVLLKFVDVLNESVYRTYKLVPRSSTVVFAYPRLG